MTEPVNNEAEQVSNDSEQVSDSAAHVEIITKEPVASKPVVARIKDPRKIEAGKKLAAYNKKAKKSKAVLKENSTTGVDDQTESGGGTGSFNITLTTVIAIIGLGLTAADLYLRHKKINEKGVKDYKMTIMTDNPLNVNKNNLENTSVCNGVENGKKKQSIGSVRFEPGME